MMMTFRDNEKWCLCEYHPIHQTYLTHLTTSISKPLCKLTLSFRITQPLFQKARQIEIQLKIEIIPPKKITNQMTKKSEEFFVDI